MDLVVSENGVILIRFTQKYRFYTYHYKPPGKKKTHIYLYTLWYLHLKIWGKSPKVWILVDVIPPL